MFSAENTRQGANPIVLHNLTAEEFEQVLTWLWHTSSQPSEFSLNGLVILMKASSFLMMRHMGRWAFNRLVKHEPPMNPVQKLALSHELPLLGDSWLRPSVGALILICLETFRSLDSNLSVLHTPVILKILAARETLQRERQRLAYTQPPDNIYAGPDCTPYHHHKVCYPVWNGNWWNRVARRLLHPETGPDKFIEDLNDVPKILREKPWEGISASCFEAFLQSYEAAGLFTVASSIIDAATLAVKNYLVTIQTLSPDEFNFEEENAQDQQHILAVA
ncbi:hypothetical protein F5876DRAFT_84786 [Lentinula aff. lateritia]|uniref:Uncharacterized protein n=1 Tax=Lentinula aff. lateritia TaxID=2804960 RepID=A0ACC1TGD6_9AGAR|nr:hypothetical protein F5876DRAFT_84786 [Lentinula aff. lateritia]